MASTLGRSAGDAGGELLPVRLLSLPLRLWQRASEHHDELMREMSLLALSPSSPELSSRLVELVDVLGNRYGAESSRPEPEIDAAIAAGLDRLDLTYDVPRSAADSAVRMRGLLDEAEAYCRTELLTLEQSPLLAAFWQWYVDQFVQQTAGGAPTPWPGPWY